MDQENEHKDMNEAPSEEPMTDKAEQTENKQHHEQVQANPKEPAHDSPFSHTPNKSIENIKLSLTTVILILFLVATVAFMVGWFGYQEIISKPNIKKLEDKPHDLVVGDNTNTSSKSSSTTASKMTMYKISHIADYSWQSDPTKYSEAKGTPGITYSLGSATRVPSVPDSGGYIGQYKDKEWVAIEVKATDNRTSGQNRAIYYKDNLRLVENGNKIPPVGDISYIAPLENMTFYVLFPIEKGSNNFDLWVGDLAKPEVFKLDFTKGTTQTGYFTLRHGYSQNP